MRISDWSSDVCSSDLKVPGIGIDQCLIDTGNVEPSEPLTGESEEPAGTVECLANARRRQLRAVAGKIDVETGVEIGAHRRLHIEIGRAHVELQSLMRISYAVFCLKKKKKKIDNI